MSTLSVTLLLLASAYVTASDSTSTPTSLPQTELKEVVVSGQSARSRIRGTQIGTEKLELTQLSVTPVLFGERDIIKSITLLPGVNSEGEGSGGFEVRGGTSAQNLMIIDGITLYNPSHVMGIFSTFNDDAISRATLYKGPIPSGYGDATSSVLDIGMAPGNMEAWRASGTIGLLAAKIQAGGPIIADKLSVAVTARRSYADVFLKMVPQYRDIVMHFYDVTGKIRYQPKPGDMLDISVYAGRDNMAIDDLMSVKWGNIGASAVWSARSGDKWKFVTTGAFTSYTASMGMNMMNVNQEMDEYIRNFAVNEKVNFEISSRHSLEFGIRSEILSVMSAKWQLADNREKQLGSGWQNSIWAAYQGQIADHLSIDGGVRLVAFSTLKGNTFNQFEAIVSPRPDITPTTYITPEPRASLNFGINDCHSLKIGAGLSTQDIHSLRSSTSAMPIDRYVIVSSGIKPTRVSQYALSYTGMTESGALEWSAEVYYKSMANVYDYLDGRSMTSDINIESLIKGGSGRSFGTELMLRKNTGRLTGWVSYTLSKTLTRIAGINGGRWYDASNDRRHNVSIVGIYNLNKRWILSATWRYTSGVPLTIPEMKYVIDGATCYYYSERNAYRTPSTHHLDISATYTHQGKKRTYEWAFGIYNLYNRYNPYIIFFEDDATKPSGTRAVQRSLYGIVPSVSYTLKF